MSRLRRLSRVLVGLPGAALPLGLCLGLGLGLGSCAEPTLSLRPASPAPSVRAYPGILDRWTRIARVHSWGEMDTSLILAATLRGPEFQQAFAARYLSAYGIDDAAERRRIAAEEQARAESGVNFLVRTTGHNWIWADIGPARGFWRMVLVTESGAEVAPTNVEPVRIRLALENELYGGPLTGSLQGPFSRSFHVTFPRVGPDGRPVLGPGTRRLILRVAGPHGKTELTWNLTS